jgi:hypothetical protein
MKILINSLLSTCFKQTRTTLLSLCILCVLSLTILTQQVQAQLPTLAWQKLFGGSNEESVSDSHLTQIEVHVT